MNNALEANPLFALSFILVVLSAIFHATWNVMSKRHNSIELLLSVSMVSTLLGVAGYAVFPSVAPNSYPYLVLGSACHIVSRFSTYFLYRSSVMAVVYPCIRGLIPVTVAIFSILLLGARLRATEAFLILTILSGTMLISLSKVKRPVFKGHEPSGPAIRPFLASLAIMSSAGYVLLDAKGAALSGSIYGFLSLIYLIDGACSGLFLLLLRHGEIQRQVMYKKAGTFLAVSVLQLASFGTFAFATAIQLESIAAFSALREISIPLGVILSWWVLRERLAKPALIGVCVVFSSVVLLKVV